jgi:hypothetical protein
MAVPIIAASQDDNTSRYCGIGGGVRPAATFAVGFGPFAVTTADLNGDGDADLITANFGSDTVSVLLGNGDGTFGAQTTFAVGINPRSVTTADVNGDGRADLIVANSGDDTVSVLLGIGDGTFGMQATFAAGSAPVSVTAADVNHDGRADLITANRNSDTVSVLLGTGTGTFGAQTTCSRRSPGPVTTADITGDAADLITANNLVTRCRCCWHANDRGDQRQRDQPGAPGARSNRDTPSSSPTDVTHQQQEAPGPPGPGGAGLHFSYIVQDGQADTAACCDGADAQRRNGESRGQRRLCHADAFLGRRQSDMVTTADGDGRADLITANKDSDMVSVLLGTGTARSRVDPFQSALFSSR